MSPFGEGRVWKRLRKKGKRRTVLFKWYETGMKVYWIEVFSAPGISCFLFHMAERY